MIENSIYVRFFMKYLCFTHTHTHVRTDEMQQQGLFSFSFFFFPGAMTASPEDKNGENEGGKVLKGGNFIINNEVSLTPVTTAISGAFSSEKSSYL